MSQTGGGPGVIQNYELPTSQPLNSLTQPAAPGQYLILWGTGLGGIESPEHAINGLLYTLDNWYRCANAPVRYRRIDGRWTNAPTAGHRMRIARQPGNSILNY